MPSGGGTTSQTTNNQVTMTPEQRQILNQMMPGLMTHMQSPPEVYGGPRVAAFNPTQILSQEMLTRAAGPNGQLQQVADTTTNVQSRLAAGGTQPEQNAATTGAQNNILNNNTGANLAAQVRPNMGVTAPTAGAGAVTNNTSMAPVTMGPVNNAAQGTVKSTGVDPFSMAAMYDPQHNANLRTAAMMGPGQVGQTDPTTRAAIDRILSPAMLNVNSNPAMQSAINAATAPITDNLLTKILPAVRSGAVATGTMGSNRQGLAEGMAIREANRAIGETSAKMSSDMYGQMLGAQTQTANAESGQLTARLAAMMQDEASRQRTSADVLSSTTGSVLGAETGRYVADSNVNVANAQAESQRAIALSQLLAAQGTASMEAGSRQAIASANNASAADIARMQGGVTLEGNRMDSQTNLLGRGLDAQVAGTGQALSNQAQNRGITIDAMGNALSGAPNATGAAMAPGLAMNAVGQQQQQQTQAGIDADMTKFTQEQYRNFQAMQDVAALIFGQIPTGSTSSSSGTQPGSVGNTASSVAQIGTMIALMSMMSERNLKTNIKRLGTHNGIPYYSFNYVYSPIRQVGFMVDEVEKINPSAVVQIGTFRYVDKSKVFAMPMKEAA